MVAVFVITRCARLIPVENELLVCIALFNTTNIPFPVELNFYKDESSTSQTSLLLAINSIRFFVGPSTQNEINFFLSLFC